MKHDAILKNATPYPLNTDKVIGYIFNDSLGRFKDCEQMVTSTIKEHIRDEHGVTTHLVTRSGTVYKLVYGDLQDNEDVM